MLNRVKTVSDLCCTCCCCSTALGFMSCCCVVLNIFVRLLRKTKFSLYLIWQVQFSHVARPVVLSQFIFSSHCGVLQELLSRPLYVYPSVTFSSLPRLYVNYGTVWMEMILLVVSSAVNVSVHLTFDLDFTCKNVLISLIEIKVVFLASSLNNIQPLELLNLDPSLTSVQGHRRHT